LPGEVLFVLGRQAAPPHAQRDPLDHGRLAIEDLDPSSPAVDHLEIGLAVVVAPTVLARQAARPVPAARAGTGIVGPRKGAITLDFVFLIAYHCAGLLKVLLRRPARWFSVVPDLRRPLGRLRSSPRTSCPRSHRPGARPPGPAWRGCAATRGRRR